MAVESKGESFEATRASARYRKGTIMHATHVNTEIAEKQIGDEGSSFFRFATCLEIVGAHLKEILPSPPQAACSGNDGAALTMAECAERYADDLGRITEAMYEQSRQATSAASIDSAADLLPAKTTPIPHAIAAVDAASLGMCCVGQLATFFDAIYELASAEALTEKGMVKRLESIRGITKLAVRFADDLHNTIDCEREKLEEALEALKGGSHV